MQRSVVAISLLAALLFAQTAVAGINSPGGGGGSGGSPTGSAGGDLAGTYPNPNVKSVTGRVFSLPATVDPAVDFGTAGAILGGGFRWEIHGNAGATDAPYGTGISSGTFTCGGTTKYDDVWQWGYNVNANGGRIVTTAPQWSMQLEAYYHAVQGAGCENFMEYSLNYLDASGTIGQRYMAFSVDRDYGGNGLGAASWVFEVGSGSGTLGNNFAVLDTAGNQIWALTPTQNSSWRSLALQTNNIPALSQMNAAGNASIELARIDASNIYQLGNGASQPASVRVGPSLWDWGGSNNANLVSSGSAVKIGKAGAGTQLQVVSYTNTIIDLQNTGNSDHWSIDEGGELKFVDVAGGTTPVYLYPGANAQLFCVRGGTVSIANACGTGEAVEVGGSVNITGGYRVATNTVIDSSRDFFPAGYLALDTTSLVASAGEFGIGKIADPGTAPGAANLKLTVVCGTNAGSAKLIARGGTSTTPVTVVDNIGSGVTGC